MLVVITSDKEINNEAGQINHLFERGMKLLHLRKPGMDINEVKKLLSAIKPQYHSGVVIHQFYELAQEFGLKGIHLREKTRSEKKHSLASYVYQ